MKAACSSANAFKKELTSYIYNVVPMWLLCDDAVVSCPQRDTIQMVSSSALLHMLCRSLFRILEKRDKEKSSAILDHMRSQMCRLAHLDSGQQAPKALTWL